VVRLGHLNNSASWAGPLIPLEWKLTVDGQVPNRLIHAGNAVWTIERKLDNLPQSNDPKENAWTFEVVVTTWKNKSSTAQFTYKRQK